MNVGYCGWHVWAMRFTYYVTRETNSFAGGSRSQRHDRQAIANDMEWMDTDQRFIQFICDDTIEMASRRGRDGKVV